MESTLCLLITTGAFAGLRGRWLIGLPQVAGQSLPIRHRSGYRTIL